MHNRPGRTLAPVLPQRRVQGLARADVPVQIGYATRGPVMEPVGQPDDYETGSIQVVDPETGKFDTLYDRCDGRRLNGPNDLVFDGAGGFWFTDLGKTRERDNDRGVVYYAKADGSLIREAIFPLERPNGIGLSPDLKTLYVVETPTARCWSFRLSAPGEIESANGLKNDKGTVAMARTRDPNSATAQFFINVADNDFLNYTAPNPRGYGYAVFGKVVKGMDVVDRMIAVPTGRGGPFPTDVPKKEIVIEDAKLLEAK